MSTRVRAALNLITLAAVGYPVPLNDLLHAFSIITGEAQS